ncbi:protein of unknown function [Blastococcus saxobsidens DD2]|uniref:Uncharacterized protein n=1 Tax=Blastococcus saxobsidens (strain DD2) TaxID=1146883 RepID=H6RMI3_BLASD|nr:protein of unknown function [Blastococcus saxobsidens DD2]
MTAPAITGPQRTRSTVRACCSRGWTGGTALDMAVLLDSSAGGRVTHRVRRQGTAVRCLGMPGGSRRIRGRARCHGFATGTRAEGSTPVANR